jgi:hypothetical protein
MVDVSFPRTCNRGSYAIIAFEFSLAKLIGKSVPLATHDCIFFAHFLSLPQISAKPAKVRSWSNMEERGPQGHNKKTLVLSLTNLYLFKDSHVEKSCIGERYFCHKTLPTKSIPSSLAKLESNAIPGL